MTRSKIQGLGLLLLSCSILSNAAPVTEDEYDYIVVGSGPGGGPLASNLARAGYSTLLIEAGDDESALPTTNVAALFASTGIPDPLHWDFWVRHYDDLERTLKFEHLVWRLADGNLWVGPGSKAPKDAEMLGVNYPRGATLGGSSIINAGAVFLPSDSDWDYVGELTGDKTWNAAHIRSLFVKLEKNNYLPNGTAGHGFNGYLDVNIGDGSQYLQSSQSVGILEAMVEELGKDPKNLKELITSDANYLDPKRDTTAGLWALPFHANSTWGRYSARNRILDTVRAIDQSGGKKFPLSLQLNSLVTRVVFAPAEGSKKPRATGVEFLQGKSQYKGDPRYDSKKKGTLRRASAKKEVIISGGAFNSPQILLLSGVGPAGDLKKLGIDVVVDLPGVGTNMQDNQEIAVIGLAAEDFTSKLPDGQVAPQCTFGQPGDPCIDLWVKHQGPYSQAGPNSDIFLLKTNHSVDGERDMTMFAGPFAFRGFWPATANQTWPEPPNTWGMHTVKMHPQNRQGYVRLRSADPTDMPEINFRLFSEGADVDIGAMKDAIAWGRRAFKRVGAPTGPVKITHPPCPTGVNPDGSCSDPKADEEWIKSDTFGHHVTSTCPIGAASDKLAVLDSKFRVRGVDGLRVVDASVFPRIPGSFPVIATYLVSEKASESILEDAK